MKYAEKYRLNVERFWSYVDQSRGPDACWPWMAGKSHGYGTFHTPIKGRRMMAAHRIAYGLTTGEEPEAVCHHCDNPPCCNPMHLFGGTQGDNARDRSQKGCDARSKPNLKGERHPQAKLSEADVKYIRSVPKKYGAGTRLAKQFGVSRRTINSIQSGHIWKHADSQITP